MALIDDITREIKEGKSSSPRPEASMEKPQTEKRQARRRNGVEGKTPDEIEAYRQKMIAKEEARYLGIKDEGKKKRRRKNSQEKAKANDQNQPIVKHRKARKARNVNGVAQTSASCARMVGPMTPLYILDIPGMPAGECLVICKAGCAR